MFLARAVCNPDAMIDHPFVENFYGLRYQGNTKRYLDWEVFFFGSYSPNELEIIKLVAEQLAISKHEPLVAWDIGGNLGHHSLYMSTIFELVHAFEPVLANIEVFKEKLLSNPDMPVTLHEFALGSVEGESVIFFPPADLRSNSGTASLFDDYNVDNNIKSQSVKVYRADDLIESGQIPRPLLIKIDVEGFEWEVLRGISNLIRDFPPVIVTEMSARSWAETDEDSFGELFKGYCTYELGINPWTRRAKMSTFSYGKSTEILLVPTGFDLLNRRLQIKLN
jgi:FkbM family methyltransferase